MFKVQYRWNSWVKKDGLNVNLVLSDWLNLYTPIDFAFSPHFTVTICVISTKLCCFFTSKKGGFNPKPPWVHHWFTLFQL